METRKAIGIDFGGTTVKPGVVRGGAVLEFAPRIPRRVTLMWSRCSGRFSAR